MDKSITLIKSMNGLLYAQGYKGIAVVPESQELSWHIFKEILDLINGKYTQITVIDSMNALKGTKGVLLTPSNSILNEPAHIIYAKVNQNYDGTVPEVTIGENISEKTNKLLPLSKFQDITKPAESPVRIIPHNTHIEEGLYLSNIVRNNGDFAITLINCLLAHKIAKAKAVKLMPGHIATRNSVVEHPELQNMLFIYTSLDKYIGIKYAIGDSLLVPHLSQFDRAKKGKLEDSFTIYSDKKLDRKSE